MVASLSYVTSHDSTPKKVSGQKYKCDRSSGKTSRKIAKIEGYNTYFRTFPRLGLHMSCDAS